MSSPKVVNKLIRFNQLIGVRWLRTSSQQVMLSEKSDKSRGGAGSIVGAGGKFAERESALENEYFHKLQRDQLAKLKTHLHDEITHHEAEIKRHQDAIARHKAKVGEIDKVAK